MCNTGKPDSFITERIAKNDKPMNNPQPGDWLNKHHESGQTLKQYKSINPVSPDKIRNKIYLQPIGEFSVEQEKIIQYTADYIQLFFGLSTIISPSLSDTIIPENSKRITVDSSIQLLAPYILGNILRPNIPQNAIVVMAITEKDLYPNPSWNYVFGLASLKNRIGVSSIYRYSQTEIDSSNYSICLERIIKTASHEISHMFSMRHCIHAVCVMNGSNSLTESDSRPNRLCSECLSKLHWNLKFDNLKRLNSLKKYFITHHLNRDYELTIADLNLLPKTN